MNILSSGIEVIDIDLWTPENNKPGSSFPERDDKIVHNIIKGLKGHEKYYLDGRDSRNIRDYSM